MTAVERKQSDGCVEWPDVKSYGQRTAVVDGKRTTQRLHRIAWEEAHGPIPKGFHVHHKEEPECRP